MQAVYFAVRFVWLYSSTSKGHFFGFVILLISNIIGFGALYLSGRSSKGEEGEVAGDDLNAKGLTEYWWDLLCMW